MVVSVEHVFSGSAAIKLSRLGPSFANTADGFVLVRLHSDIFHVLDYARVLFDAVLSGTGAIVGIGNDQGNKALWYGTKVIATVASLAAIAIAAILWMVRGLPAPGDISAALSQNPDLYTLSLGHMADLTLRAFAYLRPPLAMAGFAFAIGAVSAFMRKPAHTIVPVAGVTVMMVLFFHAARLAMVVFDPYLSSRPLAQALLDAPAGQLIVDDQYYTFSVIFYTNRSALLLNGRVNNLVYGSYAPNAPRGVFIDDGDLQRRWLQQDRYYLVAEGPQEPRLERLVGKSALHIVAESGGKYLFTNQ